METVVSTNQLCKSFNGIPVVKNLDIKVERGSIYGLLGANGGGKTTIFKILCGLISPTSGIVEILGFDIAKSRITIQGKIGAIIETPAFYEELSATDNLELHLAYMNQSANVRNTLKIVGLSDTNEHSVSEFSLGMRQRLAIARAIVHQPELLILDEPINGLDPDGIRDMRNLFIRLAKDQGMTILISSHILSEMEHIADTIGFIAKGELLHEGNMDQIKRKYSGGLEDYYMSVKEDK